MQVETQVVEALVGAAAAAIYAALWYLRKRENNGEDFNRIKFASTVLVGAVVGLIFGLSGMDVTQETILAAMAANAGVVALVEPVLKMLFHRLGVAEQYAG